jgi:toxin-antitoxin system PIN domain toxin
VILLDINLLVYAYARTMPEHAAALEWLESELKSRRQIAVPWETSIGFVRLMSNTRIFPQAPGVEAAWEQVKRLLAEPNVWIPTPTPQHAQLVSELIRTEELSTKDVPDIHLAALAISRGLKLATHDHGFARFDGLRWFDPLAA